MKTLALLLVAFGTMSSLAAAQDLSGNANQSVAQVKSGGDLTGFRSPKTLNQAPNDSSRFPDVHPNLKPKLGGIFVDGGKYGTELINPSAPASYGMGEKYLAAPDTRYDLERESGRAAHHDAGGMKLFSLEF